MSNSSVWMLFVFMALLAIPIGIVIALVVFLTTAAGRDRSTKKTKRDAGSGLRHD